MSDVMTMTWCSCDVGKELEKQEREKVEKEKQERIEKERIDAEQKQNAFIANGFGKIYISAKLDDFQKSERLEKLKSCLSTDEWIYLHGDSRSGKTHLAAAMARITNGQIIKAVALDVLISDYRNERRQLRIDSIASSKTLYIDDIGVGKLTQERHSMYYYIIDYRISNGLKTIFTSNCKTTELWKGSVEVDPVRIITRIQEASKGFEIKNREII